LGSKVCLLPRDFWAKLSESTGKDLMSFIMFIKGTLVQHTHIDSAFGFLPFFRTKLSESTGIYIHWKTIYAVEQDTYRAGCHSQASQAFVKEPFFYLFRETLVEDV
jgi:hypothetical protein